MFHHFHFHRGGFVALVAHNKMKAQMSNFVKQNFEFFKHCRIITTGSTGKTLEEKLGLPVYHKVSSGPLGGDQEIGAFVTQGKHVEGRSLSATTLYNSFTCYIAHVLRISSKLSLSLQSRPSECHLLLQGSTQCAPAFRRYWSLDSNLWCSQRCICDEQCQWQRPSDRNGNPWTCLWILWWKWYRQGV